MTKKVGGRSPLIHAVLTCCHELQLTIFFLSQVYKNSGFSEPTVRNNITTFIIYKVNKPEWKKICEELCDGFTPEELSAMYEKAMMTPHNFLVYDKRRKPGEMWTIGFEEVIKPTQTSNPLLPDHESK